MRLRRLLDKSAVKVFLFVFICFIWGSTWFTIKLGLQELPLMFSLSLRFLLAGLVLLTLLKTFNIQVPVNDKQLFLYLYLTFFSFLIPFLLVYWAELTIPSNLASILFSTMPFFAAIFSRIFLKESLNSLQRFGLILGFIGVVFIFKTDTLDFGDVLSLQNRKFFISMFAVVASAFLNASVLIMVKKYGADIHPLAINFIPLNLSGLILLILSGIFEDWSTIKFGVKGVGSVIYLGIFGSIVTFTIYYWLLKKISTVIMSLTAFLTPVFAVMIGVFVGKESITANVLFGALLVLTGMLLVNSFFLFKKFLNGKI
ncbi:EamA-like transporter family protein [Candidatus Kryptobacter tengchongensis]|nr:EamA-like transporter family protein [Candidatus Kryptobacter tengchongensis]